MSNKNLETIYNLSQTVQGHVTGIKVSFAFRDTILKPDRKTKQNRTYPTKRRSEIGLDNKKSNREQKN